MHPADWLNQVERSLLKAGLPAKYVVRTRTELADHVEECRDAGDEIAILREPPVDLAKTIVHGYRSVGIWRRVPPIFLLILPLPITLLINFAYFFLCYFVLEVLFHPFEESKDLTLPVAMTMWALFYGGKLAAPVLSGLAVSTIAQRMARPWHWTALLFTLESMAIAATQTTMAISESTSELSIDCGTDHVLQTTQVVSGLVIVGLGFFIVTRQRQEQLSVVV